MSRRPTVMIASVAVSLVASSAACAGSTQTETETPIETAIETPIESVVDLPPAATSQTTSTTTAAAPTTAHGVTTTVASASTEPSASSAPSADLAGLPDASSADAAAFAEALTELERRVRDDAAAPEEVATAGRRQQLVYRELAGRSELDAAVIAAVAADVRPFVQRVVEARAAVQALRAGTERPPPSPTVPAWTIVEPLPASELLAYYREAEALSGVAWYWLAAVHLQETRMGRIVGVSSAGAVGPMQFLPTTWAACCAGDPTDARDAIVGAATYLAEQGAPADMNAALYGYNPSEAYVLLVTAYAHNLRDDERAYRGYHAWQVFYETAAGDVRLPVGYRATAPREAAAYLAEHPEDAVG
jgi:hypothetical protein